VASRVLKQGEYLGREVARRALDDVVLTETAYGAGSRLPRHTHEDPYFCLVLSGSYSESFCASETWTCTPATLLFHPAEAAHANRFGGSDARCFNIQLRGAWARRIDDGAARLKEPLLLRRGPAADLAAQIYAELRGNDDVSPLIIEGLLLALIGHAGRIGSEQGARRPPPWLARCHELLRARFTERITSDEIASILGVHPVHLSRAFRRYAGSTVGEVVRRLRVDLARRRLADLDAPLAAIALEAGFSDQSHFTRTFRRVTGESPGRYRERLRGR
jgi:AraC family transcriptional regulator